ncbi:hypothetical protein [Brassicibacter mesophilus]|uniref:hypothetical protein n=1 Tax=Brassicibacter mesophilus TaxID=745119 RepID=UPI003D1BB90D
MKKDIKRTYGMQNQDVHDSEYEYFVFVKGNFYRYKQFEIFDIKILFLIIIGILSIPIISKEECFLYGLHKILLGSSID